MIPRSIKEKIIEDFKELIMQIDDSANHHDKINNELADIIKRVRKLYDADRYDD